MKASDRMKLYLIILKDKSSYQEADIGIAVCLDEGEAKTQAKTMESHAISAGLRAVARIVPIHTSQGYRATALLRTPHHGD
jgi:hypothetical protein